MDPVDSERLYRYEDVLRAIGRYIDANHLQDVVLLQQRNGILIRGYRSTGPMLRGGLVEHLFTDEDLKAMDMAARKQRGRGSRLFK